MQAGLSPTLPGRARYRHELRTLTYVTLEDSNVGVIRNLSCQGLAVQAAGEVQAGQQLRVRFELPPRLRFEAWGKVMWANSNGQCGIRLLNLAPRVARRLDEWILGALLESAHARQPGAALDLFSSGEVALLSADRLENDGLIVSPSPVKVIELPARPAPSAAIRQHEASGASPGDLDWLSRPLSPRSIAWLINMLALAAALLLFALVFLSVTREIPKWPLAMAAGAVIAVVTLYWGFFRMLGGASPGARLARLVGHDSEDEEDLAATRFR